MLVIGIVKEENSQDYININIYEEKASEILMEESHVMRSTKGCQKTYYSMIWNGKKGKTKIVAGEDIVQEILDSQQHYHKLYNTYFNLLEDKKKEIKKMKNMKFWNRFMFLFTKKLSNK